MLWGDLVLLMVRVKKYYSQNNKKIECMDSQSSSSNACSDASATEFSSP